MKIQTFTIDSESSKTDLCELGNKSDKSPHCVWLHYHKHPYTPIYSLLLGPYRNKQTTFCEIGVAGGESIKMWREYFSCKDTVIWAMDCSPGFLAMLHERGLHNVHTALIDVTDKECINNVFGSTTKKFDIIVDDSDHYFDSHLKLVNVLVNYLNPGGILIIEDVERAISAEKYEEALGAEILSRFESIYYIKAEHQKRFSGDFNNDSLLIFIKS
jgi:trans-aconitate methyltransferase